MPVYVVLGQEGGYSHEGSLLLSHVALGNFCIPSVVVSGCFAQCIGVEIWR